LIHPITNQHLDSYTLALNAMHQLKLLYHVHSVTRAYVVCVSDNVKVAKTHFVAYAARLIMISGSHVHSALNVMLKNDEGGKLPKPPMVQLLH
jgi:hypothetical protein